MTHNFLLTSFILVIFSPVVVAQQRFEIGVEGGPTKFYYHIKDPQQNLKNVPCDGGFGGINFRYNTKNKLFLEAGLLLSEYTEGLKLKQLDGYLTSNHDEVLFIPLRFGYPWTISKKLSFVSSLGVTTSIKTLNQDGASTLYQEVNATGIYMYQYQFRELGKDIFFLANANAAFEWKF